MQKYSLFVFIVLLLRESMLNVDTSIQFQQGFFSVVKIAILAGNAFRCLNLFQHFFQLNRVGLVNYN